MLSSPTQEGNRNYFFKQISQGLIDPLAMLSNPYEQIIWSADVADESTLMGYLDRMPKLRIVKIDRLFTTGINLGVIDRLNQRGILVFDDAKIVEIPSKTLGIAAKHLAHKPFMLNCMAGACSTGVLRSADLDKVDGLKRFADACHEAGTRPCGVTVLTSKSTDLIGREFNGRDNIEQVLYYVELLLECGFTDVVCSALELPAIRAESRFDALGTNVPGIRPAGSATGDQMRTNTPGATIEAGATRLVIGRPITEGVPAINLDNIVVDVRIGSQSA